MKRGLLIDDDEIYLRTLQKALERRGYDVATASCTEEALRQIECFHPDFSLLDLKLGQESGLNLIAALKEVQPSLVIILVTGYASVATAVEAMKRGADNYGRSDQLMHTAMQSFNSSGPSPFSLIFGSCRSPFLHQAGHSGPMALNQAHYARKSNLFRARSDFFAMTRFTSAQDTNK